MPALDFPDTPAVGDTYGSLGTIWRWDGARWASTAGTSGARGAVAYSQVTVDQGGITGSAVALTGMSATWVADPSRMYRTTLYGEAQSTAAGDVPVIQLMSGSTAKARAAQTTGAVGVASREIASVVESGLSGTQTRHATMQRALGSGTLTWLASVSYPAFTLVEDITYEAGSAGPGGPFIPMAAQGSLVTSQAPTGTLVTIPFVAGTVVNSDPTAVTVNAAVGQFQILKGGYYRFDVAASFGSAANAGAYTQVILEHNSSNNNEAIASMGAGFASLASSFIKSCAPGDILRARWASVATTPVVRYGGCSLQRVA